MSGMPNMTVSSLVAVVAPRTGKVFERGENLLQNGTLYLYIS